MQIMKIISATLRANFIIRNKSMTIQTKKKRYSIF